MVSLNCHIFSIKLPCLGGWMQIADYSNNDNSSTISYGDLDHLHQVQSKSFALHNRYLPDIHESYPITEIRFYCYKPSIGTTISVVTNKNEYGFRMRDLSLGLKTKTRGYVTVDPHKAIRTLPDDTSNFPQTINSIGGPPNQQQLYYDSVYKYDDKYITLGWAGRFECFDFHETNSDRKGHWKYYVR